MAVSPESGWIAGPGSLWRCCKAQPVAARCMHSHHAATVSSLLLRCAPNQPPPHRVYTYLSLLLDAMKVRSVVRRSARGRVPSSPQLPMSLCSEKNKGRP